jgi:AraC-like DNA-binding protein
MSADANPLSRGDISATNVLPAFETSLRFGATERELEVALGWRGEALRRPDARVPGTSTYRHMELMFGKPDYAEFVTAAARAHDAASLGLVGLACKTMPNVGAAMACHARFQRLTNRTATYETALESDGVHLLERRDDPREGSMLISDYTMLVAARLLSLLSGARVPVRAMYSRRREVPADERAIYEREIDAPLHVGARHAELVIEPAYLQLPVQKADAELERYFRDVLERALPAAADEPEVLLAVRGALRERLRDGHPTLDDVARTLGVGSRTLQRRLGALGTTYQRVLDETLKAMAEGYLKEPQVTLAEIAWLLGYVEQASFFRAFRRWYAMTPDEFRRRGGRPSPERVVRSGGSA